MITMVLSRLTFSVLSTKVSQDPTFIRIKYRDINETCSWFDSQSIYLSFSALDRALPHCGLSLGPYLMQNTRGQYILIFPSVLITSTRMVLMTGPKLISHYLPLARMSIHSVYDRIFSASVQQLITFQILYRIKKKHLVPQKTLIFKTLRFKNCLTV